MGEFKFDTSGEVYVSGIRYTFDGSAGIGPHLNPFTQGHVEALLTSCRETVGTAIYYANDQREWTPAAFSDLASETLERIMEDCDKLAAIIEAERLLIADRSLCEMGKWAWRGRQAGGFQDHGLFPVIIYLEDGKVHLRDAGQ